VRTSANILTLCILTLPSAICACAGPLPEAPETFTLGTIDGSAPPIGAKEAYPQLFEGWEPREIRFDILAGDGEGGVLVETWTVDEPGRATAVVSIEGRDGSIEEKTLALDEQGRVRLERLVKHDRGLIVEMNPGPVIFGAEMAPGDRHSTEMDMRLPRISNTDSVRASGTGAVEIEALGTQDVTFDSGTSTLFTLRETFTTDLSASQSEREIERWFDRERGLVLERWSERVRVLGFVVERSGRTTRRID